MFDCMDSYFLDDLPMNNNNEDWFHPKDKYCGHIKGRPFPKEESYHKAKKKKRSKMSKQSKRKNRGK